jgi:uncharacterized protein RhaS with RHS repeats
LLEPLSVTVSNTNHITTAGYGYDAAGNMTSDGSDGVTATYDQENRITGANGFTYTYDANGDRVEKSNGTTGRLYWYMSPGIIGELDLSGVMKSEYVFFAGERIARRDLVSPGGVFFYFADHLKTTSIVTDSSGVIKNGSDYYPWGGEVQLLANDSNHLQVQRQRTRRNRTRLLRRALLLEQIGPFCHAGLGWKRRRRSLRQFR